MPVSFGAAAKHCAFLAGAFPIRTHAEELNAPDMSTGTIRFQPEKPLPVALVRRLVKTRIAETSGKPARD